MIAQGRYRVVLPPAGGAAAGAEAACVPNFPARPMTPAFHNLQYIAFQNNQQGDVQNITHSSEQAAPGIL